MLPTLALLLTLPASAAVEVEPGVPYHGPQVLKVSAVGVSIRVARGWVAQLPAGSDAMIIGHMTKPGAIFVTVKEETRDALFAEMSGPIPMDATTTLIPRGPVRKQKSRLSARYAAGQNEGYAVARFHKDGRVTLVLGVTPPADITRMQSAVDAMAKSVRFFELKKAPQNQSTLTGPTAQRLAGRKLHRFYGASGYREHQIMVLCRDGRFFWNMEFGGFTPGVASGAGASKGHGRWAVQGAVLQLHWDDGGQRTFQVQLRGGSLYLNGDKWLREAAGC